MSEYDNITICNQCNEAYTDGFTKCPNGCQQQAISMPKSRKTAPKAILGVQQAMIALDTPTRIKKRGRGNWRYRGQLFDSKVEATRYGYLADKVKQGVIRHLLVQPKSVIRKQVHIGKTKYYKKATLPAETYTPDYAYIFDGILIIEDVKGVKNGKPYSKPQANRSHKHLMARYQHKFDKVLFMLVTNTKGRWQYYQVSQGFPEVSFSLDYMMTESEAA